MTLFVGNLTYEIHSAWPGRPEAVAEIGKRFVRMLGLFELLHPSFRNWMTPSAAPVDWEDPDEPPAEIIAIASLGRDLAPWVIANTKRDDWCKPDPDEGYWLFARNDDPADASGADKVSVFICAGNKSVDHGSFEIGSEVSPPNPALVTYPIYKGALLAILSVWSPPWANVRCSIWGHKPTSPPGLPPFPYSGFQMPWISYLCAERAAKLGPLPDLVTERTPDGGLLISATTDRFDPTNVQHTRASRQMAQIMIEHGGNPNW